MNVSKVSGSAELVQQQARKAQLNAQSELKEQMRKTLSGTASGADAPRVEDPVADNRAKHPLEQELSPVGKELAKRLEEQKDELEERRVEAAREKAKQALIDIRGKKLALRFDTIDKYDNASVLKVIDANSDELIRQIPADELLRVSAVISEYKERIAHEEMMTDPKLKAQGVTTTAKDKENIRGVVLDDII